MLEESLRANNRARGRWGPRKLQASTYFHRESTRERQDGTVPLWVSG